MVNVRRGALTFGLDCGRILLSGDKRTSYRRRNVSVSCSSESTGENCETHPMIKSKHESAAESRFHRGKGPAIQNIENGYPIVLRNRDRGHKYEL